MNNNQTVEKLRQMRLMAMASLHLRQISQNNQEKFSPDEYLALLTDHEYEDRQNRKIQRLIMQANFRQQASIAQINYQAGRNLDRNAFERLATLDFISRKENIILTGPSGVGKSYLAQALGQQACMMVHKVRYINTARLFQRLKLAKVDGTYLKEINKLNKEIARLAGKLANEKFVSNAPADVVAKEKTKLADQETAINNLKLQIEKLKDL